MAASEPILDYAGPSTRKRTGFAVVLMYAGFLSGLLYPLYTQAGDGAPLRVSASSLNAYGGIEAQLRQADADPNPAQAMVLLFQDNADHAAAAIRLTRVYYMAQYLRYPHRLFVGHDDKIINGQDQLIREAADLPTADWMLQHHVSRIYAVYDVGMGPPQLEVHPIR